MRSEIETLKTWITESDNIVFFGGAGVSTESGIPDFRSVDGLYNQKYAYPPEEIAAVWRCGDKGTAARVEYAIKKHLNHQQKEQLAAAPDTLAELLPEVGEWGVSAEK